LTLELTVNEKEVWSSSKIADELFLEICVRGPMVDDPRSFLPLTALPTNKINKYYLEAAKYASRISTGNFEGKNKKYKPVFHLHSEDFSPELRDELSDCLKTSKESLHDVIQEGVFKLFRARHKMIFFEHIAHEPLSWEFV
jgi:hypothetical protein